MKEALKLALEALESSRIFVTSREKIKHPEGTDWYDERITAIKEVLAQPEQERCVGCEACIDTACGRDECPKGWPKAAQPEQEPVALNVTIEGEAAKLLIAMLEPALDGDDPTAIRLMVGNGHSGYGLYVANDEYPEEGAELLVNTTPPQHSAIARKPLTDECERDCCGNTLRKVSDVCSRICPNGIKPK